MSAQAKSVRGNAQGAKERLQRVPLTFKQLLFRTIPLCFVLGMGLEWFMINVPIGGRNFYDVALQKAAERRAAALEKEKQASLSTENQGVFPEKLDEQTKTKDP